MSLGTASNALAAAVVLNASRQSRLVIRGYFTRISYLALNLYFMSVVGKMLLVAPKWGKSVVAGWITPDHGDGNTNRE